MAILGFADKNAQVFFETGEIKKGTAWAGIRNVVRRKLDMIHYAAVLHDLKSPPGNRLEVMSGNLAGCHSIRINDQWRIVFRWTLEGACDVRITDYH